MKYVQWIVVILGITMMVAVIVLPPWIPSPSGPEFYRLSVHRVTLWPFGDWRVDKFDLFTEMFTIAGMTGSFWVLVEMFKRHTKRSDRPETEADSA